MKKAYIHTVLEVVKVETTQMLAISARVFFFEWEEEMDQE